jgi:hypothetical protein
MGQETDRHISTKQHQKDTATTKINKEKKKYLTATPCRNPLHPNFAKELLVRLIHIICIEMAISGN